jgi:hypothetical protein
MKINYILPQFPAGREAFAQNDIDALVNMGHQVEVFSYRKSTVTSPLNGVSVITSEIQCILYVFLNFKLFLSGLLFCVQNYSGLKSFLKSLVYMVQSFSFFLGALSINSNLFSFKGRSKQYGHKNNVSRSV